MKKRRHQPYAPPRASNEHTNAEAGPSNLAAPPIPNVAPPPANPSGGTSETTADAENNNPSSEEEVAPVSNFYCPHVPRVPERAFSVQPGVPGAPGRCAQRGAGTGRLRNWAKRRESLKKTPPHKEALACKYIPVSVK